MNSAQHRRKYVTHANPYTYQMAWDPHDQRTRGNLLEKSPREIDQIDQSKEPAYAFG